MPDEKEMIISEWYPRMMYVKDSEAYRHHLETYGKHTEFGYKDFIPMFRAEHFDADRWAFVFKAAGAQYVVPVAEHHDGFQMYASDISSYNAADMGPKRDILGELKTSVEKNGMVFGASSHRIEHFFFLGEGRNFPSDISGEFQRGELYWPSVKGPSDFSLDDGDCPPTEEFMQDWLIRTCELIDRYQPKILYFDWWIHRIEMKPYLKKLIAYYYNRSAEWGTSVVINYKHDAIPFGIAVPDIERSQTAAQKPFRWQSDTAMCFNSWCYTEGSRYKEAGDIVRDLADIISKNGTMLLNIGPKADGTFSEEETAILQKIGAWMETNREAVFETVPWRIYGEGPTEVVEGGFQDGNVKAFSSEDFRFLSGNGCLYVIAMKPDRSGRLRVSSLARKPGGFQMKIRKITCLKTGDETAFSHTPDGLRLNGTSDGDMPVIYCIETE